MTWYADFAAICQPDAPLAEHTWYGLGGPARWLFTPRDEPELVALLACCQASQVPWHILGRGANVLAHDAGVDAAIIKLSTPAFQQVTWDGERICAGGGADFTTLVKDAVDRGRAGLEGLAGIPGSIGGVIRMNAGGRYGQIAHVVESVRLLQPDGQVVERPRAEIDFAYRHTDLRGAIVLAATFALQAGSRIALQHEYQRIWKEKRAAQPTLAARSAGCIFKNPTGRSAGMLLDQAGLKGTRRGEAEISTRHANFIVAHAGATAGDVLELITLAKDRVRETHGVELALEIEIW
ncbi:MAG: UDP-N-acetylmuramate dehydrogenase [Phycisphaerae bacterium]|nr:UDP-N-acetylmuramate dehydrogenase [Phycisphaerae bacterium]